MKKIYILKAYKYYIVFANGVKFKISKNKNNIENIKKYIALIGV